MIDSYEIISDQGDETLISINDNQNNSSVISCKKDDRLHAAILSKNEKEISSSLIDSKMQKLKEQEKICKKIIKGRKITSVLFGSGAFLIFCTLVMLSTKGILSSSSIAPLIYTALGGSMGVMSIATVLESQKFKENKIFLRNIHTMLNNLAMLSTRIKDKQDLNNIEVKEEYFQQDRNNSHITHVCIDKLIADKEHSIHSRWYALNQDVCINIMQKTKKKRAITEKLESVFEPINTDEMETKRYIKSIIQGRNIK